MKKELTYQTRGTCSRAIDVTLNEEGIIEKVSFLGGCAGNTKGISALVVGMSAEEAIRRLKGTRCGMRPTSCPDQLALALEKALSEN